MVFGFVHVVNVAGLLMSFFSCGVPWKLMNDDGIPA